MVLNPLGLRSSSGEHWWTVSINRQYGPSSVWVCGLLPMRCHVFMWPVLTYRQLELIKEEISVKYKRNYYSSLFRNFHEEMSSARWQSLPMRKKNGHRDCSPWAHRELMLSSRWQKWSQPAVTEPWPGPWFSCDLAVTEPWSYWICRDWAVTSPWLSCDLAVTVLWPRRDWAVTSPSRDWAVIIGPGAVTTVSPWAHGELTVSSLWIFFSWVIQAPECGVA